jgi:hypothetical protein
VSPRFLRSSLVVPPSLSELPLILPILPLIHLLLLVVGSADLIPPIT